MILNTNMKDCHLLKFRTSSDDYLTGYFEHQDTYHSSLNNYLQILNIHAKLISIIHSEMAYMVQMKAQ